MMVRREPSQEILQKVKQGVVRGEMGGTGEMEELMFTRGLTWVAGWVVAGRSGGSLWDILHLFTSFTLRILELEYFLLIMLMLITT